MTNEQTTARLEELRAALRDESISLNELNELESLAHAIDPEDVELLEPAGVPEFGPGREDQAKAHQEWLDPGDPQDAAALTNAAREAEGK